MCVAKDTATSLLFTRPARYNDSIVSVADRIADDAIRDVLAVRADIRHDLFQNRGLNTTRNSAPSEASSTYSMAVYTADALLWLAAGDPAQVTAMYENCNTPYSAHSNLGTATVRYDDGAVGTMMTYVSTAGSHRQLGGRSRRNRRHPPDHPQRLRGTPLRGRRPWRAVYHRSRPHDQSSTGATLRHVCRVDR